MIMPAITNLFPILKLYDTYQKSIFELPLDHTIKIYSCGPTVYSYLHIGNVVAVLLPDLINNTIKYAGGEVNWVCNVTDLGHLVGDGSVGEDKMEVGAKKEGKTAEQIAKFYFDDFKLQLEAVNIEFPIGFNNPKATEYIYEQMFITLSLLESKRAYILLDGVYFDCDANSDLDKSFLPKSAGDGEYTGRNIIGENEKSPEDFALWKFVDEKSLQKYRFQDYSELTNHFKSIPEIFEKWGCPGWHTECVAMIAAVLGFGVGYKKSDFTFDTIGHTKAIIDIHTGGEDHIEIHHKNELLQSMALGSKLSQHWVHNKHLKVDNQKMSKSIGNVFNVIGDVRQTGFDSIAGLGYNPLAFRLLFLEHGYQDQINFTWEKLEQSQNRLHAMYKLASAILCHDSEFEGFEDDINEELYSEFKNLLLDNLNTTAVLELFQKTLTAQVTKLTIGEEANYKTMNTLEVLDHKVLRLNIFQYPDVDDLSLVIDRRRAKEDKNYSLSDSIRQQLLTKGYQVDDYKWGTGLYRK
jgi:cysteinyl-tRNA synthetase